jgi:hypothetical protein
MVTRRTTLVISLSAAAALAACGRPETRATSIGGAGAQVAGPARRSGLWEQTLVRDGKPSRHGVVRICLGGSRDQPPWLFGPHMAAAECRRTVSRDADGAYHFASVCRLGSQAVVTSQGVASGDFSTAYQVQSVLTVSGAPIPELDGRHDVEIRGRYRGACPPGMAPGQAAVGRVKLDPSRLPQLANVFAGA